MKRTAPEDPAFTPEQPAPAAPLPASAPAAPLPASAPASASAAPLPASAPAPASASASAPAARLPAPARAAGADARPRGGRMDGVLVIDKPSGPTSHDVVARLRRLLGVKRIGHAGTLDPMASGVLVVLVGEATKLAPYLTAQDKRYTARVVLGVGTDTLDAEGDITATQALPPWLEEELDALAGRGVPPIGEALARAAPRIAAALDAERARREQTPPAYSAIKVAGQRSYALARAGQAVDLTPRPVEVRSLTLAGVSRGEPGALAGAAAAPAALEVELDVSKGYYVRSLARDLGAHLGLPAHLSALRRTASGSFAVAEAVPLDAGADVLRAALRPLAAAASASLPVARLTEHGARRARLGQPLSGSDFSSPPAHPGATVWLDPDGHVVALGAAEPGADTLPDSPPPPSATRFSVLRGFSGAVDVQKPAEE
ncbi:tRNA pseudouridine synthase B [Sorangium sp. So ce131]|uniref:tRNA pseudouridine synthase B n=1 Tax=Sorangium sp. So ce131 TaxID=3133282 RepID=UPI003F61177F